MQPSPFSPPYFLYSSFLLDFPIKLNVRSAQTEGPHFIHIIALPSAVPAFQPISWFLITWTIQHLKQLHRSDSLQSLNASSELDWIDLINKSFCYFCQTNSPMTAAHRLVWKLKGFWLDDSIDIHKPACFPQCPNDLPETPDFVSGNNFRAIHEGYVLYLNTQRRIWQLSMNFNL